MIKRPAFITIFTLLVAVKVCGLLVLIFIAIFATPDSTLQINEDRILIGDARIKILVILMLWLLFSVYIGLGSLRGSSMPSPGSSCSLQPDLALQLYPEFCHAIGCTSGASFRVCSDAEVR